MAKPAQNKIPEYQGILQESRITTIEDHLAKCYSSERYESFQEAVEKIVDKQISNDGTKEKLNLYVEGRVTKLLDERGWKQKNFWVPNIIAGVAALVAIISLGIAFFRK